MIRKVTTRRKFRYIIRIKGKGGVFGADCNFYKDQGPYSVYEIYHNPLINGCKEEEFAYDELKINYDDIEDYWFAPLFSQELTTNLFIKPPQPSVKD